MNIFYVSKILNKFYIFFKSIMMIHVFSWIELVLHVKKIINSNIKTLV